MIKKKCFSCGEKVERKFHYCPWCGQSLKDKKKDYGMLGLDDNFAENPLNSLENMGGPLGGVINQLTRQLSKELEKMDFQEGSMPKGFEIRFATRKPTNNPVKKTNQNFIGEKVDEKEIERRRKLPMVPAESKIRRLPEGIVYEIETPGVKSRKDVAISNLEGSLEIRAYSKDTCYIKNIPVKASSLKYSVKPGKVVVQIDN